MKTIQEFHLNKLAQRYYDCIVKDYKLAYYIFTNKVKPTVTAFKPYEFKFKNMDYKGDIYDIDKSSTIPNMIKPVEISSTGIAIGKYFDLGGNRNA